MGMIEEGASKRVVPDRIFVPHGPGDQPNHRIDHYQGWQLPATEDVISDRELPIREGPDPFVKALVSTTEEDQMPNLSQSGGDGVIELLPLGGEEDDLAPLLPEGVHGLKEGLRLQDHSRPAAVREVIHHPMPVVGPVSKIMNPDLRQALLLNPFQDALLERSGEDPGKECDDIIPSQRPPTPPLVG